MLVDKDTCPRPEKQPGLQVGNDSNMISFLLFKFDTRDEWYFPFVTNLLFSIRWMWWLLWKPSTRQLKLPSWPLTWEGPLLTLTPTGCSSIRYWLIAVCLHSSCSCSITSHNRCGVSHRFRGTTVQTQSTHWRLSLHTHTKHSSFFLAKFSLLYESVVESPI